MSVTLTVGESRALAALLDVVLASDRDLDATTYSACSAVLVELRVADRLGHAPRPVLVEMVTDEEPDPT